MPVIRMEPRKEGESEEDVAKREDAHWEEVRKHEAKLLAAREANAKRMRGEPA